MNKTLFLLSFLFTLPFAQAVNLENKVAIVTGAGKGIGKGIAQVFAEKGAKVVLVSRTEADLKALAADIVKQGGEASYFVGDVSKEESTQKMVDFAVKKYGRIDIVCHNAGIYPHKKLEEMDSNLWDQVIQTNLTSSFYVTKAITPIMRKQNSGRIIFISSTSGTKVGLPGQAHYTASKAGIVGFVKTAAIELAKYQITVNAVAPGTILTEGLEFVPKETLEAIRNLIPAKRLGAPKDIGHAVSFLSSDEASFITGQNLVVDGGQTLPEFQTSDY